MSNQVNGDNFERDRLLAKAVEQFATVVEENQKRQERALKKSKNTTTITAFVSILTVAMSLGVAVYQYRKTQAISWKYQQASEIRETIDDQTLKKHNLHRAMVEIRSARSRFQKYCNLPLNTSLKEELDKNLQQAGFSLVGTTYTIKNIFNEDTYNKTLDFLKLVDVDGQDPCSKEAVRDADLRKLESEINVLMLAAIEENKNTRKKILNDIKS